MNVLNLVSEESFINQTDKLAVYLAAIAAKDDGAQPFEFDVKQLVSESHSKL